MSYPRLAVSFLMQPGWIAGSAKSVALRVLFLQVVPEDVPAKVSVKKPPDGMGVVGSVLRVGVFHHECPLVRNAEVVRLPFLSLIHI